MDTNSSWRKIVEDQQKSGLSIASYCQERQIKVHVFHYWKQKFKQAPPSKNNFLPVKTEKKSDSFIVKIGNTQVTFLSEPSPTWFAKVLQEASHVNN